MGIYGDLKGYYQYIFHGNGGVKAISDILTDTVRLIFTQLSSMVMPDIEVRNRTGNSQHSIRDLQLKKINSIIIKTTSWINDIILISIIPLE